MFYLLHSIHDRLKQIKENVGLDISHNELGKWGNLIHCWWDCRLLRKFVWWILKGLKLNLPYEPDISFLGIYLKNLNPIPQTFVQSYSLQLYS